jgi:uncharacterized membrane protein YphA (DoxX/SURF4 family)
MFSSAKIRDLSLLALRLIVGAIFLSAGYAKLIFWSGVPAGMEMPAAMVTLVKFLSIVDPLGGAALIVGVLTFWASAGLAIIMVGAFFLVKFTMNASFFTGAQGSGLDYIVLIFVCCITLMAFGPGSWSVDAKRKKA